MSNTLYLECYSGISGDMAVAALLDLGADRTALEKALNSLNLDGYTTEISRTKKAGLDVCDFRVILDKKHENHDHDMKYLHGKEHHHDGHSHVHAESSLHEESALHEDRTQENHMQENHTQESHNHQNHTHENHTYENHTPEHHTLENHANEHSMEHSEQQHTHEHRGLPEILAIINQADLSIGAKETASRIFHIIAEAEAKAHGVRIEEVHFHEVGAVDSIVDIVAVAVCLDNLGIKNVIVTELCEGRGFVRCQHGLIPIPVPAVTNIAAAYGLPLHITSTEGELVTPTGAAIVAAIKTSDKLPQKFTIEKIGIGAGKRTYDRPSMLRAMLINEVVN